MKNRCIQFQERLNEYNKISLKYNYHFGTTDYRSKVGTKALTTAFEAYLKQIIPSGVNRI